MQPLFLSHRHFESLGALRRVPGRSTLLAGLAEKKPQLLQALGKPIFRSHCNRPETVSRYFDAIVLLTTHSQLNERSSVVQTKLPTLFPLWLAYHRTKRHLSEDRKVPNLNTKKHLGPETLQPPSHVVPDSSLITFARQRESQVRRAAHDVVPTRIQSVFGVPPGVSPTLPAYVPPESYDRCGAFAGSGCEVVE